MGYVDWFNRLRLHGEITADNSYPTPAGQGIGLRSTALIPTVRRELFG